MDVHNLEIQIRGWVYGRLIYTKVTYKAVYISDHDLPFFFPISIPDYLKIKLAYKSNLQSNKCPSLFNIMFHTCKFTLRKFS
jgi:hypothetical protein